MPRGPAQRGDFTGSERQRLAEENAKELAERQKQIGLVNQVDQVIEDEGIWDPATGTVVEMSPEAQARIETLSEPETVDVDPILDPTLITPGYDPMKDLQPTMIQQKSKPVTPNALEVQDLGEEPVTVEAEWRVIRVNTDVEEMTYGVGNTYTFLRGRRYRVPKHLYDWLESRGVVYH
jgi:hypothetical protein